jgi:hypothetical protein
MTGRGLLSRDEAFTEAPPIVVTLGALQALLCHRLRPYEPGRILPKQLPASDIPEVCYRASQLLCAITRIWIYCFVIKHYDTQILLTAKAYTETSYVGGLEEHSLEMFP